MLYVFFGNDSSGVRHKAFEYARKLTKEDSEITSIGPESFVPGAFIDLAHGASLFGSSTIFVLDTLSEDAETFEELLEAAPLLSDSKNHFIVVENDISAPNRKKFEKHAEKTEEFEAKKDVRFNTFFFADALLRKDKKSLWLLLREALDAGITSEEIVGVLYWQLKALRSALQAKSVIESGLKSFVHSKAKRALSAFSEDEIQRLARSLLRIYHDGHSGKRDLNLALERWMLML